MSSNAFDKVIQQLYEFLTSIGVCVCVCLSVPPQRGRVQGRAGQGRSGQRRGGQVRAGQGGDAAIS